MMEETKIIKFDEVKKILIFDAIEITLEEPQENKKTQKFRKPKVTLGTLATNDIVITNDDYVSKKHCKIAFEGEQLLLIDLGSTNGSYYEGERIDKFSIQKEARFTVGKTKILVRRIEEKEKLILKDAKIGGMIGASRQMKEIFSLIAITAPTEATVCLTGESGTGKELVAHSIHEQSPRARLPFIAINCGAIPPNIIESELFGHEKGSFTGAAKTHMGVFEQASGGTLFLDEIGEMPLEMQTRLLRVLETKKIRRIGGLRDIPVDVRIIAATNQDLKESVALGRFREDLFFRLYVIPIHIPSLRERDEDIEVLVRHFAKLFSPNGREISITEDAMEILKNHSWTGNVRELKNTIQRAAIMSGGSTITKSAIQLTAFPEKKDLSAAPLTSHEKEAILEALRRCRGNQSNAAKILKIARTTLANKIKKYGIDVDVLTESAI